MANTLVKITQPTGGDVPGGSGSYNSGSEVPPGGIPPVGTKCREDLFAKVAKAWRGHRIVEVKPDSGPAWIRVTSQDNQYVWKVTGRCVNGFVQIDYRLLQQPGGVGSS